MLISGKLIPAGEFHNYAQSLQEVSCNTTFQTSCDMFSILNANFDDGGDKIALCYSIRKSREKKRRKMNEEDVGGRRKRGLQKNLQPDYGNKEHYLQITPARKIFVRHYCG